MKKKLLWIVPPIAIILALVGYFVASPFLTLKSIKNSAKNKNYEELAKYVDFESIRQGIKSQMSAQLEGVRLKATGNPSDLLIFDKIEEAMTEAVDQMVTAENLVGFLDSKNENELAEIKDEKSNSENSEKVEDEEDESFSFTSLNEFVLNRKFYEKDIKIILTRKGLDWSVTNIILPNEETKLGDI
jgi:hypothetical protein